MYVIARGTVGVTASDMGHIKRYQTIKNEQCASIVAGISSFLEYVL